MPRTKFDVKALSIEELFGTSANCFKVPQYQRRYRWDTEQVDKLWTDIRDGVLQKEEDYFLGAIVLSRSGENYLETIDGQQRLATLTILLSVLRDRFQELSRDDIATKLHDFVIRTDFRGRETRVLTLGAQDDEQLRKYVQLRSGDPDRIQRGTKKPPTGPGRPPKDYVRNAYDHLWRRVEQYTANQSPVETVDSLIRVAEFVTKNLTLITTQVESDEYAYVIFETLNDRGLDLSIEDLLKNHLFSLAAHYGQLPNVTTLWETLRTTLESIPMPRFLRHYWLSRHKVVTQRKLYGTIKEYLKKENKKTHDIRQRVN